MALDDKASDNMISSRILTKHHYPVLDERFTLMLASYLFTDDYVSLGNLRQV